MHERSAREPTADGGDSIGVSMTVERDIPVPRRRVWDVLADGWSYSGWVVGNSRIRAVDTTWPAAGSRILHSIGTWPATINDETVVERSVSGEELVLLAKTRPAAEARVTIRLVDSSDGGCRVSMTEVAVSVPLRWIPDRLQLLGAAPRNRECLWRLAMIAQQNTPAAQAL
jgi:uncharacterized protein YndB with AHSA1/START domain